jgi:hypothetical protein
VAATRELFVAAGDAAARLIASDDVAARWNEPSALAGYTVAGLAGHLARAVLQVGSYLDRPAPPAGHPLDDAPGYFVIVLGDHDPVDSDLHRTIRERGQQVAAQGPAALARQLTAVQRELEDRFDAEGMDRLVTVREGVVLTLEGYLATRLVELVLHLDDLALSVDREPEAVPDGAYDVVAGVLARIAARRAGGLATVRSLARSERQPEAIRAL